jgi:hypothetical protein
MVPKIKTEKILSWQMFVKLEKAIVKEEHLEINE